MLSLPIPTDNLYKFACLFGLTLIVVAVFGMISINNAEVERVVRMIESTHSAAMKQDRVAAEGAVALFENVSNATRIPYAIATLALTFTLALGCSISVVGAIFWKQKVQKRDDLMAELQLKKLEAEVAQLLGQEPTSAPKTKTDA